MLNQLAGSRTPQRYPALTDRFQQMSERLLAANSSVEPQTLVQRSGLQHVWRSRQWTAGFLLTSSADSDGGIMAVCGGGRWCQAVWR
jgi:hypothetical protein